MSTRLSSAVFRPRPIDINRPLEIHRADGCVRGVPSLPTGMEPEEEEEAHIQEAIAASLASNIQADVEIPTPLIKVVDGYDTAPNPNPYAPGTTYIFYKGDDIENTVEYDIDSEDEEFLSTLNASKKLLTEEKFEFAIDRFEKEIHFHAGQEISLPRAEAILKGGTGGAVKREVLAPLLEHWKSKRANKDGNSLLTRFMKPPACDDPSPYVAFRPREKDKEKFKKIRKNDTVALNKMRSLRQEMERSRTLLEMLKKREKLKKDQITIVTQVFEQLLVELAVKSENDDKQPEKKKQKKLHSLPPSSSSITSPIPSISSPTDLTKASRPVPKTSRADYYYDIATVNTRLKIDPANALPPYLLTSKSSSSSRSSSSSSSSTSSLYPSFLQALAQKPARAQAQRSAWLLEDEDELSDYEDNDALLYEEEEESEEGEEESEGVADLPGELAKLDENAFFPRRVDGHILLSRTSSPFRGRARLGRGGRILFDRPIRFPRPPPPPPSTSPPPSSLPLTTTTTTTTSATTPIPSSTSPIPPSTSPIPFSLNSSSSPSHPPVLSPIHGESGSTNNDNNRKDRRDRERENDKDESMEKDNNEIHNTSTDNDNLSDITFNHTNEDEDEEDEEEGKEKRRASENENENDGERERERDIGRERERDRERDVEMGERENESENEEDEEKHSKYNDNASKQQPTIRSSSPVNSEPEARLHFTHRSPTQPTPSSSSLPPRTSPKLFTHPLSPSHSSVLPSSPSASQSPSPSPPPSPPLSPSASCIDKMPPAITYSKKQHSNSTSNISSNNNSQQNIANSNKRKFVDSVSM